MTGIDHNEEPRISEAARWLVSQPPFHTVPVVVTLRQRFGLSALEATQAIAEANMIRARAL